MKKLICLMILLCLVIACAMARAEDSVNLLVYMCGSELEEEACADLYEMMEANTGGRVNVSVLAGGVSRWPEDVLTGNVNSLLTLADGDASDIVETGVASMGDPETLAGFLTQGMRANPADRTIVVLWNHGAGSEAGMCFDDTAGGEGLSLNDIDEALKQLEKNVPDCHIDLLCCDACMMASYEMAALLSRYNIDYFIASEEIEPSLGFFYTPWLAALESDPGMPMEDLCASIIDSAMEDFHAYTPDDPATLSAVDLRRMPELVESMEAFAGQMTSAITGGQLSTVKRGRSRLYTFGSYCNGSWDMVDMAAAFRAYAGIAPESVDRAQKALDAAVVLSRQTDDLEACCGLSMLIPQDTCDTFDEYISGFDLSHYLPNWMAFIQRYVALLNGTSYSFGATSPIQVVPGATISGQTTAPLQQDTLVIAGAHVVQTEEQDSLLPAGERIDYTVRETDYGFSMQLTPEDMDNLDYVEGMLMIDASDDEIFALVDLGSLRENVINWESGEVYSLFDGGWYILGDQLVALYDQTITEKQRRSLIPIKLNGSNTYLVVVFPTGSREGRIIGTNEGYNDSGLPVRETRKLQPGDRITPVFTMYCQSADADENAEPEEMEFEGDEFIWAENMSVTYESLEDDGTLTMQFCFALNDIFGDYELSDTIEFAL